MRICMVTPHLPPYQSANAILPQMLAEKLTSDGHNVSFIVPETALSGIEQRGDYLLTSFNMTRNEKGISHKLKIDVARLFFNIYRKCKKIIKDYDIVHIHSNGLLHQVVALAAERSGVPYILTHYGTEIWHYKRKRISILDPFVYMNKAAASVTYYSKKLMEYSFDQGIVPDNPITIYPPAEDNFKSYQDERRKEIRKELRIDAAKVIVNVKRLHPLGGHEYLIKAMPKVLEVFPDTHLYVCGDGKLKSGLENLAHKLKIDDSITFIGMVDNNDIWKYYAAADLYVLSSVLEALPTVAVEALACGTPVVITDTPGGKELAELFKQDLNIVPMKNSDALADAIIHELNRNSRTSAGTEKIVDRYFRIEGMYQQYLSEYSKALEGETV